MNSGSTYHPVGNLSDFAGENVNGTWTLFVSDGYNGDQGTLNTWTIHPCHVELQDVTHIPVEHLEVYPNPATKMVTVKYDAATSSQNISVTDLNGRVIYDAQPDQTGEVSTKINVSAWSRGVYLLRIADGNRLSVQKLIVE